MRRCRQPGGGETVLLWSKKDQENFPGRRGSGTAGGQRNTRFLPDCAASKASKAYSCVAPARHSSYAAATKLMKCCRALLSALAVLAKPKFRSAGRGTNLRWGPKGADLRLIQGGKGPPNSEAVRHGLAGIIQAPTTHKQAKAVTFEECFISIC